MKVLVLGASGGTGRLIVEQALARGHRVTAASRNPASLGLSHQRLEKVACDVLDPAAVAAAMPGHDAVVFAMGTGNTKATRARTDGAANVVKAMERHGVKRLVAMSGLGAGESFRKLPFVFRKVIAPLMLKGLLADQTGLEAAVKASGLDWVLVRPGQLVDKPGTGSPKVSLDGAGVSSSVPRGDVAAFIVDRLSGEQYLRQAPALGR